MDKDRAEEILASLGVIEVRYQGLPVWLENIKEDSVQIQYINSGKRKEVPLNELQE